MVMSLNKIGERFIGSTLDNFECKTKEQEEMIMVLKDGIEKGFKYNVVITGGVGLGKTHLVSAITKSLSLFENGYGFWKSDKVKLTRISEILRDIRNTWKKEADSFDIDIVKSYSEVPLLIVDEVGVQYGSESERIELFDVFNNRYESMLPMICVSNLSREKLEPMLGARIVDRMFGGAKVFTLEGKSMR